MHPSLPTSRRVTSTGWTILFLWIIVVFIATPRLVADGPTPKPRQPYSPPIAAASDEAEKAIRTIRVPAGLKVELFAAEPLLANPVAFCIDEAGRFYVAETFRHGAGVTDTRGHMNWLDDDLACRTVADRVAMYRKYLGKGFEAFKLEHERLRRVVDRDGDGKADAATVFADGFNDPAAGIGAGVLARGQDVWYSCIPRLWKLRDADGDGKAEAREILHEGYGVHVGFLGHDLHGLCFGPDGRLYFSIGDRGFEVTTREGKKLAVRDTGSILRCNPDGTGLEVFATGLRNPQELAFDEYGNLFTGENNSDSGDRARWVYLVEGGDSGWRIGYQFIEAPVSRGPWNEEKLWDPDFAPRAAYLVPPIANLGDGPSGLAYNPGVSLLPDRYRGHFFLVDFRGASGQSGIRSFAVRPKGASFELFDSQEFVWSSLATDVDFGPDGALYYSDWVEGWEKPNKGRIYRVLDPSRRKEPAVAEVKRLLSGGVDDRPNAELCELLGHADRRVRQEAQFALARRAGGESAPADRTGGDALGALTQKVEDTSGRMARIHAIWALGQVARSHGPSKSHQVTSPIASLLDDRDPEIRAQAARVLSDVGERSVADAVTNLLKDESPRVRFHAAVAIGKLGGPAATPHLLALLRDNADKDPYLRHAAVMGLVGLKDREGLKRAAADPSPAVRMGVLLAFRRLEDPAIAGYLDDPDPRLVLEAARAINDVPIAAGFPRLAAAKFDATTPLPLLRRVANAGFRLGGPDRAKALVSIANRSDMPETSRLEALRMLAEWPRPQGRDKVMGLWRPIGPRPAAAAIDALQPAIGSLLATKSGPVLRAAIHAIGALGIGDAGSSLAAMVSAKDREDATRAEALHALGELNNARRLDLARAALRSPGPLTRATALRLLVETDPDDAIPDLGAMLESGSTTERQAALSLVAAHASPATDRLLAEWLDRLNAGRVPPEIRLDLIEAASGRSKPDLRDKLRRYQAGKPKDDPLAAYRETLQGGDARRGLTVFLEKAEASCLRCHKVKGPGGESYGGEVGPELTGIGAREPREYFLESIVAPDKKIAKGFESIVLVTTAGHVHTGVLRGEDDKDVRLITAEGQTLVIPKSEVEERNRAPSAMPADISAKLTKPEIRDLIEFLANLKAK